MREVVLTMSPSMGATLYGYAVESDIPLPRARSGPGERGVIRVRATDAPLLQRRGRLVRYDPAVWALARTKGGLLVWCPGTGSYHADVASGVIDVRPEERQEGLLEHRLTCLVVPLMLAERGDLALHAAVLARDGRAVAFCGASMRGKSTLAAQLGARDYALLGDDSAVMSLDGDDGLIVWPGPSGSRLRRPGERILRDLVHAGNGQAETAPMRLVAAVELLERGGDKLEIERLEPVVAATSLYAYAPQADGPAVARTFAMTARLAERVPVFRARMPDDLASAGEHADALFSAVT
jgi:hypothetical protein